MEYLLDVFSVLVMPDSIVMNHKSNICSSEKYLTSNEPKTIHFVVWT